MSHDAFHKREQAEEAAYFKQRDELLLDKIRTRAKLSEIAHAMADKLKLDDPALLDRIAKLGVTLDTAAAFLLAPLVEIAWADGRISPAEQLAIERFAAQRGVAHDSADMKQVLDWLKVRPPHELFVAALDTIKLGLTVLPPAEAEQRVKAMIRTCREIAEAAGGLESLFSIGGISPHERSTLAEIRKRLGGK
jgi:tellurite resistance protein